MVTSLTDGAEAAGGDATADVLSNAVLLIRGAADCIKRFPTKVSTMFSIV